MPIVRASGLLVSLCTIQTPSGNLDAGGAPDGLYVDVPGLQGIACTAPPSGLSSSITATEIKALDQILSLNPSHVLLDGWYPQIKPTTAPGSGMRAVIDGVPMDILGAESDSQHQMTRMEVRLATL